MDGEIRELYASFSSDFLRYFSVLLDHTALTILSPSICYSLVVVCVHEFGICAEAHEHTPQHDNSGWMVIEPSEQYGQGA